MVPGPLIVPPELLLNRPDDAVNSPPLRLIVPLLVNPAAPRLNGTVGDRLKLPRLMLVPNAPSLSVPPASVSVPSLSRPAPLSVLVLPEGIERLISCSRPCPAA